MEDSIITADKAIEASVSNIPIQIKNKIMHDISKAISTGDSCAVCIYFNLNGNLDDTIKKWLINLGYTIYSLKDIKSELDYSYTELIIEWDYKK